MPHPNNKPDPTGKPDPAGQPRKVPLLLTVSCFVLPLPSGSTFAAAGEEETSGSSANLDPAMQLLQRERRIYRGAVYEKGEDRQWHLLHE